MLFLLSSFYRKGNQNTVELAQGVEKRDVVPEPILLSGKATTSYDNF